MNQIHESVERLGLLGAILLLLKPLYPNEGLTRTQIVDELGVPWQEVGEKLTVLYVRGFALFHPPLSKKESRNSWIATDEGLAHLWRLENKEGPTSAE